MTTHNGVKPAHKLDVPFSEEAEQAVLGGLLYDPDIFPDIARLLKPNDFFLQRHTYIWEACYRLYKQDAPIDYLTVMAALQETGHLDTIGGPAYLTHLVNSVPSSAHVSFYASMVSRIAARRRLLAVADEIKALALDESADMETIGARVIEKAMNAVDGDDDEWAGFKTLSTALTEHWDMVEKAALDPDYFPGIPSCIKVLTEALEGGYTNNELTLGAGRPGMGKSAWLVSEAIHAAKLCTGNEVVLLFTLEMPTTQIAGMATAAHIHVPPKAQIRGRMSAQQINAYVHVQDEIKRTYGDRLLVDDNPDLTPAKLKAKCKRVSKRRTIKAVFVDYAQLMNGGKEDDYGSRQQELGYVSRSLKKLAKTYHIPVIAAAQLSRKVDERQDKRPKMSDLRESGDLENDADVIIGLYRDEYYNPVIPPSEIDTIELSIMKGREVQSTTVLAGLRGALKQLVNVERRNLKEMVGDE